jgi:hypothetical protein
MSKLTPTQFSRISQYIKMYDGDRETLQFAWSNTWDDDLIDDYYDLTDNDIENTLSELREIVTLEAYILVEHKELLDECEMIYQQWRLIKGKIVSK